MLVPRIKEPSLRKNLPPMEIKEELKTVMDLISILSPINLKFISTVINPKKKIHIHSLIHINPYLNQVSHT